MRTITYYDEYGRWDQVLESLGLRSWWDYQSLPDEPLAADDEYDYRELW